MVSYKAEAETNAVCTTNERGGAGRREEGWEEGGERAEARIRHPAGVAGASR